MLSLRSFAALAVLMVALPTTSAKSRLRKADELSQVNCQLQGRLIDITNNHGEDRRFYSAALGTMRDMYVYVPPGYDVRKAYPVIVWLHGFSQDEHAFLKMVPKFDQAVAEGKLPPVIVAVPDGTFKGKARITRTGSFFVNGKQGNYEDLLVVDVWNYLNAHFAIRPEKEAHVIAGASMGGFSAFNIAIKHRDIFQIAVGILPLLDLRYADCHGNHFGPFDPNCMGRQEHFRPLRLAGRLYGVIPVREGAAMRPVFGNGREIEERLKTENPAEILDLYDVKPGELKMFIAYGARDQFNVPGEVDSFLYFAGLHGLTADVVIDPNGRHNKKTGVKFFGPLCEWLTPLLEPYVTR
jgi:hypothetical protein